MSRYLPQPKCKHGYTDDQIREIMADQYEDFIRWMDGQTMTICDGRSYNHDTKEYEVACDGEAHGPVVYVWDVLNYFRPPERQFWD